MKHLFKNSNFGLPTSQTVPRLHAEAGVVLLVAMIMLILISLLAVTSMRNSASTEALAGNVRTVELATQAADLALRHCEASALKYLQIANGDTTSPAATYSTTLTSDYLQPAQNPPLWQNTSIWNSSDTRTYVLPSSMVGGTATYQRPPECMVESLPMVNASGTNTTNASYVVTARGFGPEVAALANAGTRVRPVGTVVWLQSTIEFE